MLKHRAPNRIRATTGTARSPLTPEQLTEAITQGPAQVGRTIREANIKID